MIFPVPFLLKRVNWCKHLGRATGVLPLGGFAGLAFLLAACGSSRPIKYYQVSYPTKAAVSQNPINTSLIVRPFDASQLYLDNKMVYGFDTPEMGTYEYHRWTEPPVEIMQTALVRGLRSTGQYRTVYTVRPGPDGQFILSGQIYDFKEVDGANIVARLSYHIRMRDRKTGFTVWDHTYSYDEPVTEKTVSAVVLAMDKNIQRSVQEVAAGLEEYFRAHPLQ
jgi:ABC-type uncharacterized transport system auxiliary subunit